MTTYSQALLFIFALFVVFVEWLIRSKPPDQATTAVLTNARFGLILLFVFLVFSQVLTHFGSFGSIDFMAISRSSQVLTFIFTMFALVVVFKPIDLTAPDITAMLQTTRFSQVLLLIFACVCVVCCCCAYVWHN